MSEASQRPRRGRSIARWALLCSLAGCMAPADGDDPSAAVVSSPSASQGPQAPRVPAVVDYGPCISMQGGAPPAPPRCVFTPGAPLRLWVEPERLDDIEVFVDGRRVATHPLAPVDDASRGLGVRLGEAASRIEVGFREQPQRWALSLRALSCAECHDGGDEARALVEGLGARMFDPQARGDWRDDLPRVLEQLGGMGASEDRVALVNAAMFALAQEHRFDAADEVRALAGPAASTAPRLAAVLAQASGVLDWRRGRYDDALTSFRAASLHAVRTSELDIGLAALPMYAELLGEQGYTQAASRWSQVALEQARAHGDACDVAATLRTTAWAHLRLRQQAWSSRDPAPMLEEALAIYGPGGECPRPDRTGGARSSLALLQLQRGMPAEALAILRETATSRMTPGERVLASDVELRARLALGQDRARIAQALQRLRRAVEDTDTTDARWHLALREGQVSEARGEHDAAIEAYREAEGHVDGLAQLAAFGVGRSTVGVFHRESNERLVDALRAQGRTPEALCVARQGEARRIQAASLPPLLPEEERVRLERRVDALRSAQAELEELLVKEREAPVQALADARAMVARQRRTLETETDEILRDVGRRARPPSCDELHPPAPGELLLGLFPRGDGWLLFAQDEVETTAHAVELRELDLVAARARLAELLLRPVAEQLRRARRLRVHAVGQAQRIDVELLPWEGKPLVARMPVAWGVDVVAPKTAEEGPGDGEPRAVLLADPTGSLPEAETEVREATELLVRMGWHVEEIAREDARPHVLQERMATAVLLHYAGHAEHDELLDPGWWPPYPGGTPSWPASLRLFGGSRLAAHEILVRSGQVPRKVILSGCRTGAIDASASGTSLAVAFLVAGAEEVLATAEVTRDADARSVVRGVYAELEQEGGARWSLVDALARVRAQRSAVGVADGGYRVWVR